MSIKRGDIYYADLSPVVGSEQGGVRPVLIVQNDMGNIHSSCTIIMPLSSKLKSLEMPTHTIIHKDTDNGLKTDSVVLGEQMRVISSQRIIRKIGSVTDNDTKLAIKKVYEANFGE